ncbi:hypothetical protein GCM10023189_38900 [Nibrella saemangeumensis]|uniref:XRE family transcriptional regulator n=1 Tax=Nibrella saemangeumensis TaxID=1084526 RepID=A0ABP8N6U6_9BACT
MKEMSIEKAGAPAYWDAYDLLYEYYTLHESRYQHFLTGPVQEDLESGMLESLVEYLTILTLHARSFQKFLKKSAYKRLVEQAYQQSKEEPDLPLIGARTIGDALRWEIFIADMTLAEFARKLAISVKDLNDLLTDKAGITEPIARALASITTLDYSGWMALQREWELTHSDGRSSNYE